ncbi:MAG TPA: NAD(P)H-dependent oxidoreductase [Usitatibacter sp.]|nr:NAD(P)H-dependent oxidoreductase [Usitatibacter sp.]
MILVVYAHPYPGRSRACAALLAALAGVPGLERRSLYELYPDFDVDIDAEQAALLRADAIVWLHPMYWYSAPALMHHWLEKVMVQGFAYGGGGSRIAGKPVLWATTTGGDASAFSPEGRHHHEFAEFVPAIEQTARYCGLEWREPFMLHGAHLVADAALAQAGEALRARIAALVPAAAPAA